MNNITLDNLKEGSMLLFDKPLYWTSFDLVNKIRRVITMAIGEKLKVGHAGTLDPLATGLLIVCTGRRTKTIEELMGLEKEYIATIRLGSTTPSFDLETEVDNRWSTDHITEDLLGSAIKKMKGEQMQVPPAFSAKSVGGKRSYEMARKGIIKEPSPVKINISELEIVNYKGDELTVRVVCSKGTYIRSLARDIGIALNSGGHLVLLKRTRIGNFTLEDAVTPDSFEKYVGLMKQNSSKSV